MTKFNVGEIVIDDYLGRGKVERAIKSPLAPGNPIAYVVLFDKTPDARYNMGQNPTMVFSSSLRRDKTREANGASRD